MVLPSSQAPTCQHAEHGRARHPDHSPDGPQRQPLSEPLDDRRDHADGHGRAACASQGDHADTLPPASAGQTPALVAAGSAFEVAGCTVSALVGVVTDRAGAGRSRHAGGVRSCDPWRWHVRASTSQRTAGVCQHSLRQLDDAQPADAAQVTPTVGMQPHPMVERDGAIQHTPETRGGRDAEVGLRGLCSVSTSARRVAADAAVAVVRVLNGARMATAPEGFVGRPGVHDGNRSRRGLLDVPNDGTYRIGTPGPRTGVEPATSCARPVATGIRAGALPDELPRLGAFTDATLPRRTW